MIIVNQLELQYHLSPCEKLHFSFPSEAIIKKYERFPLVHRWQGFGPHHDSDHCVCERGKESHEVFFIFFIAIVHINI